MLAAWQSFRHAALRKDTSDPEFQEAINDLDIRREILRSQIGSRNLPAGFTRYKALLKLDSRTTWLIFYHGKYNDPDSEGTKKYLYDMMNEKLNSARSQHFSKQLKHFLTTDHHRRVGYRAQHDRLRYHQH